MYTTLLFVHILAGIAWIGTGFALVMSVRNVLAKDGQTAADLLIERSDWATKWVFIPAPLLVLATGLTMVFLNQGVRFTHIWVAVALVLFLTTMGLNGAYGSKLEKRMVAAREAGQVDTPEYRGLIDRYIGVAHWDLLIVVAIVAMMVFKPI